MVGGCFTGGDDVHNLSAILALTLLYGDYITKDILPLMRCSKDPGKLLSIDAIKWIGFINAPSIFHGFNDRDALICLKGNDPQAQERVWLHCLNGTPHDGLELASRVKGFESSMFKQFDLNLTKNILTLVLSEVQERSYLDRVHTHWCPHSELLPINRIKHEVKLFTYVCNLFGFQASLLLLLNTISA